uniref:Uncharacterized protein n=1 Tax=Plectus sambesii TaxID=2011161 RepID=A0A914WH34_9BILA
MQWVHKGSMPPKKFRIQPLAGKIMATIFWDAKGLVHIDYMPHKSTITRQCYADLLYHLRDSIRIIWEEMITTESCCCKTTPLCTKSELPRPPSAIVALNNWITPLFAISGSKRLLSLSPTQGTPSREKIC